MGPKIIRRQRLLFLLAILLPCAAIVALGLLLMSRERELAEKRRANAEHSRLGHFSQDLQVRLERIKLQQMTALAGNPANMVLERHADPAVTLAAAIDGKRLLLPWDMDPALAEARRLLADRGFRRRIDPCEHLELRARKPDEASACYRQILPALRAPAQIANVRLLLARALVAADRAGEAREHYQGLLTLAPGLIDDQGMPFRLYAAAQLIQSPGGKEAIIGAVRKHLAARPLPSPVEAYKLLALIKESGAPLPDIDHKLHDRIRFLEQALALQND